MDDNQLYEHCEKELYRMLRQGLPDAIFFYLDKIKWNGFKKERYINLLEEIKDRKHP